MDAVKTNKRKFSRWARFGRKGGACLTRRKLAHLRKLAAARRGKAVSTWNRERGLLPCAHCGRWRKPCDMYCSTSRRGATLKCDHNCLTVCADAADCLRWAGETPVQDAANSARQCLRDLERGL